MKHYERRIIEFRQTATQAAGTVFTPTPFEIEVDEMGEIVFAEVFPPVTTAGVEEIGERWYPVLDATDYDNFLALNFTRSSLMNPPELNTLKNIVAFGTPLVEAVRKANPMLEARCPTLKRTVGVKAWAGTGGTTAAYRIRLHVYVYRVEELRAIAAVIPGLAAIEDQPRRRRITIAKSAIPLTYENWDKLPGGVRQEKPWINPFMTWAENEKATTPNVDYSFRAVLGTIDPAKPWQELYFNFEDRERLLIVNGIGVRAPTNLKDTCLIIDGDEHPRYRIPTQETNNPIHFGWMSPFAPTDHPYYVPIKRFDIPYIIYDEIGEVVVRDNGTSVPADQIKVALSGIKIEGLTPPPRPA